MRVAGIVLVGVLELGGCSGKAGSGTEVPPPVTMSIDCEEAVRDAVPAGSDLAAIVAAALPGSTILVGPGAFPGPIEITQYGVTLRGTCPAVTFIDGDGDTPGLRVFAGDALIERLTVRGGAPGIEVTGQSWSATLHDVVVDGASEQGIKVGGQAILLAEDVVVTGTAGRGLTVLSAGSADLTRATITGSTDVAVHVDAAALILRESTISGIAPEASGVLGRGVQAQRGSTVEVIDSIVEGSTDAGICAIDSDLTVRGTRVSGTVAGTDGVGDGIAFFLGPEGAGSRTLITSDTELVGNARAALIVDGEVGEGAIFGGAMSGGPYAIVTQHEAEITVDGAEIEPGMQTLEGLTDDDALPINDQPLD
jgi:hypothetical protein